jgi:hypothetical protein
VLSGVPFVSNWTGTVWMIEISRSVALRRNVSPSRSKRMHSRMGIVLFDGTAPLTVLSASRRSALEAVNFMGIGALRKERVEIQGALY